MKFGRQVEKLIKFLKARVTEFFCCCTASMEQAADRPEAAAIDGLIWQKTENICYGH